MSENQDFFPLFINGFAYLTKPRILPTVFFFKGTAAKVRVLIQSSDDKTSWGTVGVSENIIKASWIALADSIRYKLNKEKV